MEDFMGTIKMVGFDYAPKGWLLCDGSLLPIEQNMALYSLLKTAYGGDGVTTFALPDLRGCVAGGAGQAKGGPEYEMGKSGALAAEAVAGGTGEEPRVVGVNFIICNGGVYPMRP